VKRRAPSFFVSFAFAVSLNGACAFKDLDYLRSERGQAGGAAGTANGGTHAFGGSVAFGGSSAAAGGTPDDSGGNVARGGSESGGGMAGESAQAGAENSGGESFAGAPNNGGAGSGSGGADGGTLNGGGGGALAMGGTSPSGGRMTYGVDGQSCAGDLKCPGGQSCCRRFAVPVGTFDMGTNMDPDALSDEKPPHAANLAAFELDEFEVTVSRMRRFVEAYDGTPLEPGMGAHPAIANSGWQLSFTAQLPASRTALEDALNCDVGAYQTWTTQAGAREDWPINCVNWYIAFAFCAWDGGRLPTEAEWEKASAGGSEERLYPWGATAPDFAVHAVANCRGDGTTGCAPTDLLPVGSRSGGAGRWKHQDLAGSLWEWTLDHYDATYYQSIGTCTDCADVSASTPRVIRGGNFTSTARSLRSTGRASKFPGVVDPYAGFRCAH
jgi:formylglycine-generating enzyme required for sulfatase activity